MKDKTLKIGVHVFAPLAFKDKNAWTGFEIELWEKIAKRLGLEFEYKEESNFSDLLSKTANGGYDVAIAGISRTVERSGNLNMSFSTLYSGLGIISRKGASLSIKDIGKNVVESGVGKVALLLLLAAFIYANLFWLVEQGQSVSATYLSGVLESFWWAIVTFSTVGYGDIYPLSIAGKLFGVFVIMTGLAIFGLYVGSLSSTLTIEKGKALINDARDLFGAKVGTKKGTTTMSYLNERGATVKEYGTIKEAYRALVTGKVEAVVFDAPVLRYDLKNLPSAFALSGDVFAGQSYAFMMPKTKESEDLIERIDQEIVREHNTGEYDKLYAKYFN